MSKGYIKPIYDALFSSVAKLTVEMKKDGKIKPVTLKKISIRGLRAFRVPGLLFIEQNPKKKTRWAEMAKRGAKIMWVLDTNKNKYLMQVIDGRMIPLWRKV